jgi:hypothetical protein
VGKHKGKRPLGTPRYIWDDNITRKLDLQEVGCDGMDWTELARDRDRWWAPVNAVMNLWVPKNAGSFLARCTRFSFSRRTLLHRVSE